MLKTESQLSFSSKINHFYSDLVARTKNKLLIDLAIKLLDKFIKHDENIILNKLNLIIVNNEVWNKIKEIKGFKKRENYELIQPLVNSTRRLLLLRRLSFSLTQSFESFSEMCLIEKIIEYIPEELQAEILEELLNHFLKQETLRCSPPDSLLVAAMQKDKPRQEAQKEKNTPIEIEEAINRIKIQKQNQLSQLSFEVSHLKKDIAIVYSELSQPIHSVLVELRNRSDSDNLLSHYLTLLDDNEDIKGYANRPAYKLALRIRNMLILKKSTTSSFSKQGIQQFVTGFERQFSETLEISLFKNFIKNKNNPEIKKSIKHTTYVILCMLQNKISRCNNLSNIKIPDKFCASEQVDNEYLDFWFNFLNYDEYKKIESQDLFVNLQNIISQIHKDLDKFDDNDSIKSNLEKIFFDAAQEIALINQIELDEAKFSNKYFSDNLSDVLLEFTRIFLSKYSVSQDESEKLINKLVLSLDNFENIYAFLEESLNTDYSWNVYFPVKGIKINDDFPHSWFTDLAPSLVQKDDIKFLIPKILGSISIECFSQWLGKPVLYQFENVDSCAVVSNITAKDNVRAARLAVTKLQEVMETHLYLTSYGHQYKVTPVLNAYGGATCFSKKIFQDNSESQWYMCELSSTTRKVTQLEVNDNVIEHMKLPPQLVEILFQRKNRDDLLGNLAKKLLRCIRLYRQGYFAEEISDRFRLNWTILDYLLAPEDPKLQSTDKIIIPYRVSLFCLGIVHLIEPGDTYTYKQAQIWMREDIEDLYSFLRNPLIHEGVELTLVAEKLMERLETIVNTIIKYLFYRVIFMDIPDIYLEKGIDGIIGYIEAKYPENSQIPVFSSLVEE
ncbi:MAG: hypothetical protein Tsb0014_38580 [Pleurocapsa sp.]